MTTHTSLLLCYFFIVKWNRIFPRNHPLQKESYIKAFTNNHYHSVNTISWKDVLLGSCIAAMCLMVVPGFAPLFSIYINCSKGATSRFFVSAKISVLLVIYSFTEITLDFGLRIFTI